MEAFTISSTFDRNKVFILRRNKIEKRFDPFYYIPDLVELENQVMAKLPQRLKDFVVSISSGATPKTSESELYYTDKENGIPFLRVQNLSPTGILEFDDCKYITKDVHNGMLKRSQVFENDLLVKITGVGRMAIASVAPVGFEGNINQHICVIKTESREVSETIAAYLNSDIGEKIASRRSTGGTRPALDYPALMSIPVIKDKRILTITQKVVAEKLKNEAEAERLLASIDDYLLSELGITLPEQTENTLENRIYTSTIKSISGNRFDPFYHQIKFIKNIEAVKNSKYAVSPISDLMVGNLVKGTLPKHDEKEGDISVVQINCINPDGTISLDDLLTAKDIFSDNQRLLFGDILVVITGATIGKIALWNYEGEYYLGGDIVKFQTNSLALNSYVFHVLRSIPAQIEIRRNITGATNGHLAPEDFRHILIPLPPIEKQIEIADYINLLRKKAQNLKNKTNEALKVASKEIEKIILS